MLYLLQHTIIIWQARHIHTMARGTNAVGTHAAGGLAAAAAAAAEGWAAAAGWAAEALRTQT